MSYSGWASLSYLRWPPYLACAWASPPGQHPCLIRAGLPVLPGQTSLSYLRWPPYLTWAWASPFYLGCLPVLSGLAYLSFPGRLPCLTCAGLVILPGPGPPLLAWAASLSYPGWLNRTDFPVLPGMAILYYLGLGLPFLPGAAFLS
jgi:hypothetical protein